MRISIMLIMAAILSAQTPSPNSKSAPAPAGDAQNGKKIFASYGCYQCHGYQGQGGAAGPRIAPDPLPFDGLAAFVRTTSGEMPPYTTTILSDSDLADIYAYLQSIPRPPALADVPLLKQQD